MKPYRLTYIGQPISQWSRYQHATLRSTRVIALSSCPHGWAIMPSPLLSLLSLPPSPLTQIPCCCKIPPARFVSQASPDSPWGACGARQHFAVAQWVGVVAPNTQPVLRMPGEGQMGWGANATGERGEQPSQRGRSRLSLKQSKKSAAAYHQHLSTNTHKQSACSHSHLTRSNAGDGQQQCVLEPRVVGVAAQPPQHLHLRMARVKAIHQPVSEV